MNPNDAVNKDKVKDYFEFSAGTTFKVVYTERTMTVYGIEEEELESISDANHNFTLWRSISAASAALFAGCVWDMINAESVSNNAIGFAAGAVGTAVIAFLVSIKYSKMRNSRLERIKNRSRPIEA